MIFVDKNSSRNYGRQRSGTLSVELLVAIAVMATLFGILARFGNVTKKVDNHHWTQLTLSNAGQAQMDAIAATGKPIDEATFKRLWPAVTCDMMITDGQGQWAGLSKVQLHLSAKSRNTLIQTDLIRYMSIEKRGTLQ